MNMDMMKFLIACLALVLIYALIGCADHQDYRRNKSILDQHRLDSQQFINDNPEYREVFNILNKPAKTNE